MNADSQAFGDLKPIAPARPKMAFIGVTDRCNTRCRHCPHYHYTFGTDMCGLPEGINDGDSTRYGPRRHYLRTPGEGFC